MRALIVYESIWGNSEQVARAIAAALEPDMSVEVVNAETAPESVAGYDLVVIGGPTHAFSMSRPTTRQSAVDQQNAPKLVTKGIREWLDGLEPVTGVTALAFDTRIDSPRLPGSAAKAARHELRSHGFDVPVKAMTFRVAGTEGPLIDGELERAAAWARESVAT
jgi:flavodoxin